MADAYNIVEGRLRGAAAGKDAEDDAQKDTQKQQPPSHPPGQAQAPSIGIATAGKLAHKGRAGR